MKSAQARATKFPQPSMTLRNILMWLCTAVFYAYQFVLRVSPSVMTGELQDVLSIEACALGTVISFYYYGYAGFQIPVGLMLDRVGVRRPLTLACGLCLVGCLFFITGNLIMMSIGRFLMGVGSAFGFLSSLKIATLWLPMERYAFFIGLSLLLGTTGAASAGSPLSFLIDLFGWKETIMILSGMSGLLALASYIIIKEHPSQMRDKNGARPSHEFTILESISMVLKNRQTWIIGFYGFLMYIPLSGFADLWGVPYIMKIFDVGKSQAAGSVSMFYIGVGVGAPFSALAADFFKSHKKPVIYGTFLTCAFFTIALYCTWIPFYLTYIIFLMTGMFSASQFLVFATITSVNPPSISGAASGLHNMLCMISGILAQPLIGYFLDYLAGTGDEGISKISYSQTDYKIALAVVPICLLLSAGVAFFVKESYSTKN